MFRKKKVNHFLRFYMVKPALGQPAGDNHEP